MEGGRFTAKGMCLYLALDPHWGAVGLRTVRGAGVGDIGIYVFICVFI